MKIIPYYYADGIGKDATDKLMADVSVDKFTERTKQSLTKE